MRSIDYRLYLTIFENLLLENNIKCWAGAPLSGGGGTILGRKNTAISGTV
jgi:hypothetical protein